MITVQQKDEACIELNKMKLLVSEAVFLKDNQSMFSAMDLALSNAAMGLTTSSGTGDTGSGTSGTSGGTATVSDMSNWNKNKLEAIKFEINACLLNIENQIKGNI